MATCETALGLFSDDWIKRLRSVCRKSMPPDVSETKLVERALHDNYTRPTALGSEMQTWYAEKMLFYATGFRLWGSDDVIAKELRNANGMLQCSVHNHYSSWCREFCHSECQLQLVFQTLGVLSKSFLYSASCK